MHQWIIDFANHNGALAFGAVFLLTFFQMETVVLLLATAISGGMLPLNLWLLLLWSVLGSFLGDQLWFAIGRRYGARLMTRWPVLRSRSAGVFRMLRRHQDLFILSFRFIYGLRNVSPLALGMSDVSSRRFLGLNAIAALLWGMTFVWGGAWAGHALEDMLGTASQLVLGGVIALGLVVWLARRLGNRQSVRAEYRNDGLQRPGAAPPPTDSPPACPSTGRAA